MKYVKLLAVTLFIAVIVNCAKNKEITFEQYEENGIRITKNNGTPADTTLQLNFKKVFSINAEIDSVTMLKSVTIVIEDKDQNIYILDWGASDIKKFNKLGEFQKTIGRAGQGPGEFAYPAIMFINNDTLTVYNNGSRKVSKFDLDGNFYYEKKVESLYFQNGKLSPDGKNLSYDYLRMLVVDTKDIIKYGLSVLDIDKVKEKSEIQSTEYTMADFVAGKFNPIENTVTFCVGSDLTYLSDDSDYQYRFTAYDNDGNKKMDV
ncbi:MAG: 6-bladed beta-propeller, partial [Candidatus Delongbacteria bacterium]|nr:6-bladed beta-propeller [Candidatus Delongbacteria bacterium]